MGFLSALVIFKDCQHIIQTIELLHFCCRKRAQIALFGAINFVTLLHMSPRLSCVQYT